MKLRVLIFPFIVMSHMYAQQNAQPLRLADCIAKALGQNPSLQISEAKVQAAEARSSEATAVLLPQLKLSGRAARLSAVDPFGINIQTALFSFSKEIFPFNY